MWLRHWHLTTDPFPGPGSPYVPTAGHEEAVARLVATIESRQRFAALHAGAGAGKSVVLRRAMAATREPGRRVVLVSAPVDGTEVVGRLAAALGQRVPRGVGRAAAWRALVDALRVCGWQKLHAVLVVDDVHFLDDPADRRDLDRLVHLEPSPVCRLTLIQAGRLSVGGGDEACTPEGRHGWHLAIRLPALMRSETVRFVLEKLAAAGRIEPAFTPRALGRLHDLAGGVPRGIERLASLALMAGAVRGLEIVTPEVVQDVSSECAHDDPLAA